MGDFASLMEVPCLQGFLLVSDRFVLSGGLVTVTPGRVPNCGPISTVDKVNLIMEGHLMHH
jgi:hypothetical protein